ncbi:MAG: hypothetical protein QOE06_1686 [Thermoleophilaceae bacterium]|nr:hypothetical protein [Thermoleophilaceae bacterium]
MVAVSPAVALAGPDPVNQPLSDGCQRNAAGLLTFSSPEWVFVGGKGTTDATRVVEGTTTLSHTADEDLPESHTSYDFDTDVVPDPSYLGLLAGSPTAGNGNFAHDADMGKLHVEWESRAIPAYVWPTEGDRVKLWGQWVWDCGHWGEGIQTDQSNPQGSLVGTGDYLLPGQVEGDPPPDLRGEQTELHPMEALVVTRRTPWAAAAGETQTDTFISNDGTHAFAEERCARDINPLPGLPSYGPDFTACANTAANEQQPVRGRSYDFFVPAPPRPSPGATLDYREIVRVTGSAATEQVTEASGGLNVHVSFPDAAGPLAYGTTFLVGWHGSAAPAVHLRLTLHSVTVVHSLDPNPDRFRQTGPPPGEYNLYLDANGRWTFIGGRGPLAASDELAPALGAVTDGQVVPVEKAIDLFVPAGRPLRLAISGRECDLPRMDPCVVTAEVSDSNDHPGQAIAEFPSPDAALGAHRLAPDTGNYSVDYSVERVADGGVASPPGTSGVPGSAPGGDLGGGGTVVSPAAGCDDRLAPASRFRVRASRRRALSVRGTARDRGCAGAVARVTVAVARRTGGGGCRYLQASGRFGRGTSCRRPTYVAAAGTAVWSLRSARPLARGTYVVRSRAIDAVGNVERKARLAGARRNFVTVRIR